MKFVRIHFSPSRWTEVDPQEAYSWAESSLIDETGERFMRHDGRLFRFRPIEEGGEDHWTEVDDLDYCVWWAWISQGSVFVEVAHDLRITDLIGVSRERITKLDTIQAWDSFVGKALSTLDNNE